MKLVIFGLSMSSSWGNGHATLWRGLCRALHARGHRVVFFERDVPYYAAHRDMPSPPFADLVLYSDLDRARARRELDAADAAIVTSFCPDGPDALDLVLASRARVRAFYDLDTPVTLADIESGGPMRYLAERGLGDLDLVLSFAGGRALRALERRLGARRAVALHGSVDPEVHRPSPPATAHVADLSYLGTWAEDRSLALDALLVEPARRRPALRFAVAGALYPREAAFPPNVAVSPHVAPGGHAAFYGAAPLTLSITRRAMAAMGHCPSGRLFEAAACGVPVLSDAWEGVEAFFRPGDEILIARTTDEALAAIEMPRAALARIGAAARERVLAEHTADHRARELEAAIEGALLARGEPS